MTDPLSVAGSVVGVISLGVQVTQSLVNFYQSYRGQDSALLRMGERLDGLLDIFQGLEKTLSDRKFEADERTLVDSIERSIENCDELIQELQDECLKFKETSSKGIVAAVKGAGRRATYPFRQSTLQKIDEDIGEIRANLSSAMDVLQLKDNKRIQDDIYEMKALMDLVRTSQTSSNLRDWLNAPDATINHNTACAKKHPGTGIWLVKGPQFSKWLTEENSIMWLNGFAGSGKSVLCSTAIQYTLRHRRSDPGIGIAFFYFTFNDKSKQDESAMLRALLLQLSSQLQDGHTGLTGLRDSYSPGIPPSPVLLDHLRRLIERFHDVYIVLDALDESPPNGPRKQVLDALETIRNWDVQCLHLFVTSRDEPEVRESLDLSPAHQVDMRNNAVDKDIGDFTSGRLSTDRRLRKFSPYHTKIQESLAKRAKGMFRWVDCQLEALQSCPCSDYHLDQMLRSLPESLDETYERMLRAINPYLIEDARRILTLLCFASRPLAVQELIDGVAVEINNSTGLNRKRRLQDANGIRDICGAFIDIGLGVDHTIKHSTKLEKAKNLTPTVRIAHFSIQEYLESERIRQQKAAIFSLTSATAHAEIAQLCLVYLLEPGLSRSELDQSVCKEYPLAHFAAMYWYYHYQKTAKNAPGLDDCILRMFQHQRSFTTWVMLHDIDNHYEPAIDFNRTLDDIASPIYYASLLGLGQALLELTHTVESESIVVPTQASTSVSEVSKRVNALGGFCGNALQAASGSGHKKIVQMLLDRGADVNSQGGHYDNALLVASTRGHEKIVQILLDRGADVNAQSGNHHNNALQAASYNGHEKIVQILLDRGADVNAQSGYHHNALPAALRNEYEKVLQILLERGADVNARGEYQSTALQMLLKGGADVNVRVKYFRTALQISSFYGHDTIVQMLLDRGADVNAQDEFCITALQEASEKGHDKIVQMLLKAGADVTLQDQHGQSATENSEERQSELM